jgi:threonine synthase
MRPSCRSRTARRPSRSAKGLTPLQELPKLAREIGVARLWVKDEGLNPTASFKARGMSAAVTRAKALGVSGLVVPTAGNAGAAMTAYGAPRACPCASTRPTARPRRFLDTISTLGAQLCLVAGHIGDAGQAGARLSPRRAVSSTSRRCASRTASKGKKTMGIELAEQLGWALPTHIIYPTGGGTGLIGMWKVFAEMRDGGWLAKDVAFPKMVVAQADGCAPMVRAFQQRAEKATPWENPTTHAKRSASARSTR